MRILFILLVRAYQHGISPLLGNRCRYFPSCSSYAATAIQRHGVTKGLWLTINRLARCHPWHPGGVDPVPEINVIKHRKQTTMPTSSAILEKELKEK